MRKITFYGWHVGLRKVAFTLLLRNEAGLSLKEANDATARVLEQKPATLEVPAAVVAQAEALGVKCRLEPAPEAS